MAGIFQVKKSGNLNLNIFEFEKGGNISNEKQWKI